MVLRATWRTPQRSCWSLLTARIDVFSCACVGSPLCPDINDVTADQGCTSCVRGSHRLSPLGIGPNSLFDFESAGFCGDEEVFRREEGYRRSLGFAGSAFGRTEEAGYAPTRMMPNHVKFAAQAGDCCIFDLATCAHISRHCIAMRFALRWDCDLLKPVNPFAFDQGTLLSLIRAIGRGGTPFKATILARSNRTSRLAGRGLAA